MREECCDSEVVRGRGGGGGGGGVGGGGSGFKNKKQ